MVLRLPAEESAVVHLRVSVTPAESPAETVLAATTVFSELTVEDTSYVCVPAFTMHERAYTTGTITKAMTAVMTILIIFIFSKVEKHA